MRETKPTLAWLEDPEVFQVNRIRAHADHYFYEKEEEVCLGEQMPLRQSLNGSWKFSCAENPSLREKDFYLPDYDCSHFAEIQVPGHIQMQGWDRMQYINTMYPWDGHEELRPPHISREYNPVGSYVKEFELSENLKGKRVFLSFQGVETAFYVWLNGSFAGYSEDSFTPAEFEVTKELKPGINKLAVEVYKRSSASWLEDQDFWRFSGIFREVYLYGVPKLHVRDLSVRADLSEDYKEGVFALEWELLKEAKGTLEITLEDCEGTPLFSEKREAKSGEIKSRSVGSVRPWSAEIPNLYVLLLRLYDETGTLVEIVRENVGFRRFEKKNGLMCINGKRIIFRGVNRHEFSHKKGRAIEREEMLWDIRFMKRHNINAVRTSHYPNQSLWYRLCDEYGIYLIDETNLESHGSWQKLGACEPSWNVPGSLPVWRENVLDRAKSMLERDKNHPSVLIWSCGNESYAGDCIQAMTDYFHKADSSRLVHYEGGFWNRSYPDITDMESRMYAKPEEIEEYLKGSPEKPYISCEYMHAMGNSCGGMKLYTDLEDRYEKYQGGFIWDYIDQAVAYVNEQGEAALAYGGDFDDRATDYEFCTNGIVYADRSISPKAQEVKKLYEAIRLIPDRQGVKIENRNNFVSTKDYVFAWKLLLDGKLRRQGVFAREVEPLCEAYQHIGELSFAQPGEYVLQVSALLGKDELWAEKGFEVAFGEYVHTTRAAEAAQSGKRLQIVHGDGNIGVKGEGFSAMFSKAEGGLASLCYHGREYITRKPGLTFWRALTDNDRGCGLGHECACWLTAGLYPRVREVQTQEDEAFVTVTFVYGLFVSGDVTAALSYRMTADGTLLVRASYEGAQNLPDLPAFGMEWKLKERYHRFSYYGLGPEENYIDRREGARLGIYESTAGANMSRYLVPQECGNRVGVRWLEVKDETGYGLRFEAAGEPFEASVLPYSARELDAAAHREELARPHYTWVRILARQMGVGGDDSWGAPVHPQYRISSREKLEVAFTVKPV